jgi:hypothetical protein
MAAALLQELPVPVPDMQLQHPKREHRHPACIYHLRLCVRTHCLVEVPITNTLSGIAAAGAVIALHAYRASQMITL